MLKLLLLSCLVGVSLAQSDNCNCIFKPENETKLCVSDEIDTFLTCKQCVKMIEDKKDGNATKFNAEIASCRKVMMGRQPNCTASEFGPDAFAQLDIVACTGSIINFFTTAVTVGFAIGGVCVLGASVMIFRNFITSRRAYTASYGQLGQTVTASYGSA